jgi:hypothetical protein
VTEKVTAVKHCNNRDIWVLAHGTLSNTYYAFLVTTAGIITTPVISNTGIVLPGTDSATLGYLKASPDGKRLAAANWTVNAEVSDFDNRTGVVSNTYDVLLPSERYYWAYAMYFILPLSLLIQSMRKKEMYCCSLICHNQIPQQ